MRLFAVGLERLIILSLIHQFRLWHDLCPEKLRCARVIADGVCAFNLGILILCEALFIFEII